MIDDVGTSNPDPCGCSMLPLYIIYTISCMFEVYNNGITKISLNGVIRCQRKRGNIRHANISASTWNGLSSFCLTSNVSYDSDLSKTWGLHLSAYFFETKKHKEKLYKVQFRFCFSWN